MRKFGIALNVSKPSAALNFRLVDLVRCPFWASHIWCWFNFPSDSRRKVLESKTDNSCISSITRHALKCTALVALVTSWSKLNREIFPAFETLYFGGDKGKKNTGLFVGRFNHYYCRKLCKLHPREWEHTREGGLLHICMCLRIRSVHFFTTASLQGRW